MSGEASDAAAVRVPPPLVYLAAIVLGVLLQWLLVPLHWELPLGLRTGVGGKGGKPDLQLGESGGDGEGHQKAYPPQNRIRRHCGIRAALTRAPGGGRLLLQLHRTLGRGGDPYGDEQGESGEGESVQDVEHRQSAAGAQHDERDRGGCGAQSTHEVDGRVSPGRCRTWDGARCRLRHQRDQGLGRDG